MPALFLMLSVATLAEIPAQQPHFELEELVDAQPIDDDRLVIAAPRTPAVLVLDFRSGRIDTLGRPGEGPGEYRLPNRVAVLANGRVAAVDGMTASITSWKPDGTLPDRRPSGALVHGTLDGAGNIVGEAFSRIGTSSRIGQPPDTTPLIRIDASSRRRDTVAMLLLARRVVVGPFQVITPLYAPTEHWGVAQDGTAWIASGIRHRVEWYRPGGTVPIASVRLEVREPPTTAADRRPLQVRLSVPDPTVAKLQHPVWPTRGAFATAVGGPGGEVWVQLRWPLPDHRGTSWAVFRPTAGATPRLVRLPSGPRLIAVSQRYLFVTRETEDGFMSVTRTPRP